MAVIVSSTGENFKNFSTKKLNIFPNHNKSCISLVCKLHSMSCHEKLLAYAAQRGLKIFQCHAAALFVIIKIIFTFIGKGGLTL